MKKLFSLLAVSVVAMSSLTPTLLFAQSNDEVVKDLLATSADW
jgi:putative cell wall-binding protein